jgi:hypothetical protein
MGPLDVMVGQPVCDAGGWVDVHKTTLQHNKYGEAWAGAGSESHKERK